MNSEIENYADFSKIRYAQCWEDADVLVKGIGDISGKTVLSIASAGDNTLSLLCKNPKKIIAVDMNPAQIACLELRKAAYKRLSYEELLQFAGIKKCKRRAQLYRTLRSDLPKQYRIYWDNHHRWIRRGFYHTGKFENYFHLFSSMIRMIHSDTDIDLLLTPKTRPEREIFYETVWNNRRWRIFFRVFFSKRVMGRFGRDPAFFRYVQVPVAESILERARYAFVELDPSENPYLHYIMQRNYGRVLPFALREENFQMIKENIDRVEGRVCSVEEALTKGEEPFGGFNLSDIFEYMSEDAMTGLYNQILERAETGSSIVYWNMLVPRSCPKSIADRVTADNKMENELFLQDKAFFYSALHIERLTEETK